jgi:1,2-diacylglycerol 3-alpha-glucosyltransferase
MSVKPLTIFLVTNNYKPYEGGVARSIDTLCNALQARGNKVYIITLDFLGNQISDDDDHVIRIPCFARWCYKKNHLALPIFHGNYLKRLAHSLKPDVIHVHHPFLLGVSGLQVGKSLSIPVIFTYHTQYEHYLHYIPLLPEGLTTPVVNRLVKQFCCDVDSIIVPTATIQEQLQKRSITTPMQVIPSAIESLFFNAAFKKKEDGDKVHLLSVSRFAKEKNIEFLLRVVKQLGSECYKLTLVGYGEYENYLHWYAYEKLGLAHDTVEFIIKPSRHELSGFYSASDLFIFASLTETQGLVLTEAMASGLPVIALDAPGSRDIICNEINGFLVQSEQEMVSCIIPLEKDKALYEKLRINAFKSSKYYRPEVIAGAIEQVYRELL